MNNPHFEQARQAVADTWTQQGKFTSCLGDMYVFWQEVGEFMANEAVKAERQKIESTLSYVHANSMERWLPLDLVKFFKYEPLPFPQQPDER